MKYTCSCCGKEHEDWPAISYDSPDCYSFLSEEEKSSIATLSSDFCIITYEDQTDRFIRVRLVQKVNDSEEDLEYGFWVSLSEKSFLDYQENFDNENHLTQYFGWLYNTIPQYNFDESIPTTVVTQEGNNRPEIFPHEDFDHPFVKDYYNGISRLEADKRIHDLLDVIAKRESEIKEKPW